MCPKCRTVYRYQEWVDGIHNFNNSLLIGLDVCSFLRAGIQNHVALGRSLSVLENMLKEKLNYMEIENAYLHFEALSDHGYDFNCVLCGYHPSILIWDTFRKARFRYAVSDLSMPSSEQIVSDTVDAKSFWSEIEESIILSGMNPGLSREVRLVPNYERWSPWIGPKSRIGDNIYNTEYKKCSTGKIDKIDEAMPEELLLHLLMDEKVSNIRKICKEAGVRSDGSSMDMILRLRQMSVSRCSFDKAYEKVFGCSGGWAVGCCRHGIVYGIKNLLRSESPRDYIDLERSLKHRPNITISDIAHLLATHGNKTCLNFFSPNDGRLDNITEDNIQTAESSGAIYSLPFLQEIHVSNEGCTDSNYNPTTGSSDHFSLYDWFHQQNCKKREEILRRCSLVREISGLVDTKRVEQLFSSSKKDLYFLNNLSPTNHMFLFRLMYHLRNQKLNSAIIEKQKRSIGCSLTYNKLGQICQNYVNSEEQIYEACVLGEEITVDQTIPEEIIQEDPVVDNEITTIEENEFEEYSNEDLKCQVNEFQAVKDIFTAILKNVGNLTPDEVHNLQANMRYANTILFARADNDRMNQVQIIRTPFGHFQSQGTSNYCGLCCINNAIELPNLITVLEMDSTADRLWLEMGNNPCYGFTLPLEPLRDRDGFYSIEVLQLVLQDHGYNMMQLNCSAFKNLSPEETGTSLCQQLMHQFGMVSLIVRPSRSQHWVSIKLVNGVILFLDSKTRSPMVKTYAELGSYILLNMRTNEGVTGAVYFVFPSSDVDVINAQPTKDDDDDDDDDDDKNGTEVDEDAHACDYEGKSDTHEDKGYGLRSNPKQKRRASFWYALDYHTKKIKKSTKIFLLKDLEQALVVFYKVTDLPDEILTIILKEVVLSAGITAYKTLSLVCKTFRTICYDRNFQSSCRIEWLYNVRPDASVPHEDTSVLQHLETLLIEKNYDCNTEEKDRVRGEMGKEFDTVYDQQMEDSLGYSNKSIFTVLDLDELIGFF